MSVKWKQVVAMAFALPAVSAQQPYNNWDLAYEAAEKLVSSWSIEERANISVRNGIAPSYIPFTPVDGPMGLVGGFGVSGWPSPQALASSWDPELTALNYGAMAQEFSAKGYSMLLAPVSGALGRSVLGGRNHETFGSDPYLNGKMFAKGVEAVQENGVVACAKHFLLNEQETRRLSGNSSSNVDDRTLQEVYLWPWGDGVAAGMAGAMCSMNAYNGTVVCESETLMNDILKGQLGFKVLYSDKSAGVVVPDVTVPINKTRGLLAGLDWNSALTLEQIMAQITNGSIPESVMTEHAVRIVASSYQITRPQDEFPSTAAVARQNVRQPSSAPMIRKIGGESIILLKNSKATLPINQDTVNSISVFGRNAGNLGNGPNQPSNFFDYQGETYMSHLVSGGGPVAPSPYIISPLDALSHRAAKGKGFGLQYILSDNFTVVAPPFGGFGGEPASVASYASASEYAIVFLNAFAKENADRRTLDDATLDKLVQDVATYNNNTIVVINSAGVRLVDAWIEHPNITAVLQSAPLGQESGNAIVDVLFGEVNPSGKLPYTVAKSIEDYNGQICKDYNCDYTEGLFIDYRHFDKEDIEPRFEFGYGLSYTSFNLTNLEVTKPTKNLTEWSTGPVGEGGRGDLFEEVMTASVDVENTGKVAGAEVAQLYLTFPKQTDSPKMILRGFKKVFLEAGEHATARFVVQRRDLSVWDTEEANWRVPEGEFVLHVGQSSRDINESHRFTARS